MKIVLDASAALAVVLRAADASAVLAVLRNASVVMAPEHFVAEVTSGLWKYVVARHYNFEAAADYLRDALQLVEQQPTDGLVREVLKEASERRHPVYDIFYVVLARREGAALMTLDKRLRTVAGEMGVTVYP